VQLDVPQLRQLQLAQLDNVQRHHEATHPRPSTTAGFAAGKTCKGSAGVSKATSPP
jgi:hypothetical protein